MLDRWPGDRAADSVAPGTPAMIRRILGLVWQAFTGSGKPHRYNFGREIRHAKVCGIPLVEIHRMTWAGSGLGNGWGGHRDALIVRCLYRLAAVNIGPDRRGTLLHGMSKRYEECFGTRVFGSSIPDDAIEHGTSAICEIVCMDKVPIETCHRLVEWFPQFCRDLGNEPTVDAVLQWFLAPLDNSASIP